MTRDFNVARLVDALQEYVTSPTLLRSPPPKIYTDPDFFGDECAHVIRRGWFCIGRASDFATAGDYLAFDLAGEPVLVISGLDGRLRALSNICRHRLYPLVGNGAGSAPRLTCAYHRWNYHLDGRLAAAPTMEDTPGFDPGRCSLPSFRIETWLGFVFVSLDRNARPLAPRLEGIETAFARHDIAQSTAVAAYDQVWAGNWKLALENASESYHHMGLHRMSLDPYMPGRDTSFLDATDDWAAHRTPILPEVAQQYGIRLDYPTRLEPQDRGAMPVFTVFPAFVLLSIGDLVTWISFIPHAVDRTQVRAGLLLPDAALATEPDPAALRQAMDAGLAAINAEDEVATRLIQHTAAARSAERGALSTREAVLPSFYRYLATRMTSR